MTTYTIAYINDLLLAVVPDETDIRAAVQKEIDTNNLAPIEDYEIKSGLLLTNDRPTRGEGTIIFASKSGSCGWITDQEGLTFDYAVKLTCGEINGRPAKS